jgi:hypothetical protein
MWGEGPLQGQLSTTNYDSTVDVHTHAGARSAARIRPATALILADPAFPPAFARDAMPLPCSHPPPRPPRHPRPSPPVVPPPPTPHTPRLRYTRHARTRSASAHPLAPVFEEDPASILSAATSPPSSESLSPPSSEQHTPSCPRSMATRRRTDLRAPPRSAASTPTQLFLRRR